MPAPGRRDYKDQAKVREPVAHSKTANREMKGVKLEG
jgi:hypothetical protein